MGVAATGAGKCPPNTLQYLDREFEVDCYRCLDGGENGRIFILRGSNWECIPCAKFPHRSNGRLFGIHFVVNSTYCAYPFLFAKYRTEDMDCADKCELFDWSLGICV